LLDPATKRLLPWVVAIAFFMQTLDGTILNTALPAMAKDLGESPLRMQSVVIAYMLTVALFIPASGWLADRFGTRRAFLAAIVLYILASSNVRGFAFTLMVTTIIDVLVVFLFTHPLVSILATTKFFGQGHKWSGLDPEHLGAKTTTYAGRGRVTIAARRAAAEGGQS